MKVFQLPVLELNHFWRRGPVFTDAKNVLSQNSQNLTSMLFCGALALIEPVSEEKFFLMFQSSIHPAPRPSRSSENNTKKNPGPWVDVILLEQGPVLQYRQGTAKLAIQGRYNRQQLFNPKP